jgi:hypothetical protein
MFSSPSDQPWTLGGQLALLIVLTCFEEGGDGVELLLGQVELRHAAAARDAFEPDGSG